MWGKRQEVVKLARHLGSKDWGSKALSPIWKPFAKNKLLHLWLQALHLEIGKTAAYRMIKEWPGAWNNSAKNILFFQNLTKSLTRTMYSWLLITPGHRGQGDACDVLIGSGIPCWHCSTELSTMMTIPSAWFTRVATSHIWLLINLLKRGHCD